MKIKEGNNKINPPVALAIFGSLKGVAMVMDIGTEATENNATQIVN